MNIKIFKGSGFPAGKMTEAGKEDTFFDHINLTEPTRIGKWFVRKVSENIFTFAGTKRGEAVLEIGPGRGVFADICLGNGVEYQAIEPNRQMATSLEKRGVVVTRAVVPPLPEMDRVFDIVVMINVMEHMSSMRDALQASHEIKGILKPKGRFVVCSPDYVSWGPHFFWGDFSHNYVTTACRLRGLLISAGFTDIKTAYVSGPFTGAMSFLPSALASWLPFGRLDAMFPENNLLHKLYEAQLTFLRGVLILGEKPG